MIRLDPPLTPHELRIIAAFAILSMIAGYVFGKVMM